MEFGEPPQPPTRLPQQEKQQQQQQLTLPQESLEELAESDGSEKETGPEEEEEEEDKAEEDEEELEERLVGTEQVADFASALMNILHCWHCRANALLFSGGSMVRCPFSLLSSPICMLAWCMTFCSPPFLLAAFSKTFLLARHGLDTPLGYSFTLQWRQLLNSVLYALSHGLITFIAG